MTVTCKCGQTGVHTEFHLDTFGSGEYWLCDYCYYATQPWHNGEGGDTGIA